MLKIKVELLNGGFNMTSFPLSLPETCVKNRTDSKRPASRTAVCCDVAVGVSSLTTRDICTSGGNYGVIERYVETVWLCVLVPTDVPVFLILFCLSKQ